MHLYWINAPKVRKVGHFYIGPDGLLIQNQSGELQAEWYARDEPDATTTPGGEVLYTQTITQEGYFTLASPQGTCRFTPVSRGFQTGVNLACDNGTPPLRVRADDDSDRGKLRLYLDGRLAQVFRYDVDTGRLTRTESGPK